MYSYMLQAAEERLRKRQRKASKEEEVGTSSSTPATGINDLPSIAPSLASTSSPCTTTPPSLPFSPPSTIDSADTPEEPSFSSPLQNPNSLIISTTSAGDGAAATTADAPSLFPILLKVSSSEPLDVSPPPAPSADLGILSISGNPHSPSSFSFETNVPPKDNLPSPIVFGLPPPSLVSASQETSILPSSSPSQIELPSTLSPELSPLLENISPSSDTPFSSSFLLTNPIMSSPPPFPTSSTLQEELMSPIENLHKTQ